MQIKTADSISSAFQTAKDLVRSWGAPSAAPPYSWYRGSKSNSLSLQPGACWRSGYKELDVLVPFSQEGVLYAPVGGLDDWDTYYLAQHHRIPTRLLDWSESFAAAIFFAFDGWDASTIPCVWILRPDLINKVSIGWEGILAPENNKEVDAWLPRSISKASHTVLQDSDGFTYDNDRPLAIYPKRSNMRIGAQQGMFTVHGRDKEPLDTIASKLGGNINEIIARIDLINFDRATISSDLRSLGIRRSSIYPDIDNFVLDLKEFYNW